MGNLCFSCCAGEAETNLVPSPETRRQRQLEAAERRRQENESRGIKNLDSVRRQQERAADLERREREAARNDTSAPTLKWQAD